MKTKEIISFIFADKEDKDMEDLLTSEEV